MQTLEEIKQQIKELSEAVAKLEGKEEWPRIADAYYSIQTGTVGIYSWANQDFDKNNRDFLGVYRTEEEAQLKLNLIKALCPSKVWVPTIDENYWWWHDPNAVDDIWDGAGWDSINLSIGNCFKTKEEAEAYGATLKAWADYLMKK